MKSSYNSNELSLSFKIDPNFDGILRGCAHDECEGCVLSGELIMVVHHLTKIKLIETSFEGEINVNFRATNSVGIPTNDGIESRVLCHKRRIHFNQETVNENSTSVIKTSIVQPGAYKFPFKFDISGSLPHSFQGKYGNIQYRLDAYIMRTLLTSDIHISHPITLRRCLMNNIDPVAPVSQTVVGDMLSDILHYSATAPSIVYCEGGLLQVNIDIQLVNPEKHSITTITCGLQERALYRTTGLRSVTNEIKRHPDIYYPLGYSSCYPSKQEKYNSSDKHNFNAIFRLCPRVHTDNKSSLIVVQHRLFIQIVIEEKEDVAKKTRTHKRQTSVDSVSSTGSASSAARMMLSYLSLKKHNDYPTKPISIPNRSGHQSQLSNSSPSASRDQAILTPPLSPSNSSDEIQVFSVSPHQINSDRSANRVLQDRETGSPSLTNILDRGSSNSDREAPINLSDGHFSSKSSRSSMKKPIECYLKIPIVVTSREEYREGSVPAIPDYDTAIDSPPPYRSTIRSLPPVPNYLTATIQ